MNSDPTLVRDELDELQRELDAGVIVAGSDEHRARLAVVAALEAPVIEPTAFGESASGTPAAAAATSSPRRRPVERAARTARRFVPRFVLPSAEELLAGTIVTILIVALLMAAGGTRVDDEVPMLTGIDAAPALEPVVPAVVESCDVDGTGPWGPVTATATGAVVAVRWTRSIESLESETPFVVVVAYDREGMPPRTSGSAVDQLGSRQLWFAWDGQFATTSVRTLTPDGWDAAVAGTDVTTRFFARGADFTVADKGRPLAAVVCG